MPFTNGIIIELNTYIDIFFNLFTGNNLASQHGQSCHHNNRIAPERPHQQQSEDVYQSNFTWAKLGRFFAKRPILKLFLVIFINGLISMAFAAVFIEVCLSLYVR